MEVKSNIYAQCKIVSCGREYMGRKEKSSSGKGKIRAVPE
jgi:hypothetical protein